MDARVPQKLSATGTCAVLAVPVAGRVRASPRRAEKVFFMMDALADNRARADVDADGRLPRTRRPKMERNKRRPRPY